MASMRPFSRGAFILVTAVTGLALLLGPLQPALALTPDLPVPVIAPGLPVAITANAPEAANQTYKNIYSELTRAGVVALTNAAQLFLGQMAYDAAEYIATGGKGQGKLFFDGKFGEYLSNVGGAAVGEFMGSLSDSSFFRGIGFNLCQPRDPTTLLRLQTSLGDLGSQLFPSPPSVGGLGGLATSRYNRPQARCDFQTVVDNYDTLYRTMSNGDIIRNLEQSFDPSSSQLGTLTSVYNRFLTDVQRQVTAAATDRQEGGGFRPLEGLISGNVRTPASVIQEATNEQVVRKPGTDQSQAVQNILSNAWEVGPTQLAIYTGSIFLNTLASKFLQRIFEKGLGGSFTPSAALDLSGPDSVAIYGKTDARNANIDLKNPPAQQVADYDVVSQMQTCLPAQRGAWNCVMDQSLVQAVRSKTTEGGVTVREALDRGLLHKEWRLIPESRTRENQDDKCYTQAYCATNLQKMRLMRILPIGFEFAANSPINQRRCDTSEGCVTLEQVANGFTDCNAEGKLDDAHPWCHLIDPNWVITSFPQQCTLTGYTDTLVSSKLPIRKEECQDIQTCLSRNDKGECTGGYGYCMAERPVYRFSADVCPAYAASCRIYTDSANKTVGYLRNSIDRAACDSTNAGCLWYATTRATSTAETTDWAANTSTGNRMYFKAATPGQTATTKGLESCPAGDEGCTRLYAFTPGKAALNLLINGSFEAVDPTTSTDALAWRSDNSVTSVPTVFSGAPALPYSSLVDTAYLGTKARLLSPGSAGNLLQSIAVTGGRSYAFSFYARSQAGAASLTVELYPSKSPIAIGQGVSFTESDLSRLYRSGLTVGPRSVSGAHYTKTLSAELSQEWQRFEYNVVIPSSTQGLHLFMRGSQVLVDGMQVEEGEYATSFIDTFTSGLSAVFMKVAPDELQCTKPVTDTTRSPLCNAFAQTCNQLDAGCQGYRDQEGGQEVPAILSENDLCPAMCVGYSEYRKSASSFDLVKDIDPRFSDPAEATSTYFIPRTAGQCTQQDVGCENFTVVDSTGATDGGTAAYSYLRACEKPGNDSETYFTWEGADTVGYQLRTWSLKKDTSPLNLGPRTLVKIQADQISFKEPDTCNEGSWRTAADPDCRQFYDATGRMFYRYFSQTILSSEACVDLRLSRSSQADCQLTGGRFNERGECTYGAFLPESRSCNVRATSCRMFTGANSGNSQSVLKQSFRDDIAPFESAGIVASSEALLVGDKSARVGDPGSLGIARARAPFTSQETALYRATFWGKVPATSTTVVVRASAPNGSGEVVVGTVRLTPEWQRFTVGMFEGAPNTSTTLLTFSSPLLVGAGYGFYLDEVSVVRVQDVVYVRNNTWTTPAQCDQGLDGAAEPQAMLNCKAYTNRLNQTVNARRFTRLCRETSIGCTAFVDTRNTDETYGRQIVQPNPIDPVRHTPSVISLQPDRYLYLIDDPNKRCNKQNMSCRAFGKPKLAPDRQTLDAEQPYETVYFKDDITRYNSALCKPSEAFCAEYKYGSVKEYFRDPGTSLCEYRQAEVISGAAGPATNRLAGWYVKGTPDTACYPSILEGGNSYGLARSGDATYKGYVGTCAQAAGECTELRDINDTSDPTNRAGKSYFYIKNDRLDTSSCNGTVDLGRGCVLFRDMSSGALNYNVRASYEKYRAEGYKPVTPVDCRNNPENPQCNQPGRCSGTRTIITRGVVGAPTTVHPTEQDGVRLTTVREAWTGIATCRTDNDCAPAPVNSSSNFTYLVRTGLSESAPRTTSTQTIITTGTCSATPPERLNDANLLLKVSVDRECSQWLGCRSSETVLDPSTNKYKQICTVPALCDKGTGQANDPFCASYVDRRTTTTEPVLTQGAVLDAKQYSERQLGLGQKDYSGYAIPNAFQVMDLQSVRVAVDGAKTVPDAQFRLSQDYRLTAAVAMPPVLRSDSERGVTQYRHEVRPTKNQAKILGEYVAPGSPYVANVTDTSDGLLIANPGLSLCKHMGSGRIGYFRPDEVQDRKAINCYLPIHSNSDLLDFQNVAEKFSLPDPVSNSFLTQAYPPAECRAQPEQDAPFPASFTTEWNTAKNPAKPVRRLAGFATANTCEFGEDCSCTYKRIEYENLPVSKFYNQYSNASPPGICVGGPRDGEGCVPSKIFNSGTNVAQAGEPAAGGPSGGRANAIDDANLEQLCGPPEMGGQCMPAKTYTLVRGTFGNCLERDLARTIGSTQGMTPCLTWNPSLVMNGDKDVYHYTPTAGYMPPQNSGQYYCVSEARKPKTVPFSQSNFVRSSGGGGPDDSDGGYVAGNISRFFYHDDFVSEMHSDGNERGSIIDGSEPDGSGVAADCEYVDDDQDAGGISIENGVTWGNWADRNALRIVNTGRGTGRQYTETFFRVAPAGFISARYDGQPQTDPNARAQAMSDTAFAYFSFSPIRTPNSSSRIGCGYNADWVDNLPEINYDEADSTTPADRYWQSQFNAEFKGVLTRSSEKLVTVPTAEDLDGEVVPPPESVVLKAPCLPDIEGYAGEQCYFKTWETDYRSAGQKKFVGLGVTSEAGQLRAMGAPVRTFEEMRVAPVYGKCDSLKPYFSIRAVFQSKARARTTPLTLANASDITDMWVFTGFWVTACGGSGSTDEHFIYMYPRAEYGDVCRELAEVVSRDSHQDAAFTDRIWKDGSFTIPVLGIVYNARYAPFSSALNTRPAGTDPLFQTSQEVVGYSPLNPPTFLAAGFRTYGENSTGAPKNKWAYLSNIFARVYRIYRYQAQAVGPGDSACLSGPNKGTKCVVPAGASGTSPTCSLNGVCRPNPVVARAAGTSGDERCNALSGINAGLVCLAGEAREACHQAPIQLTDTGPKLRQLPCLTQPGWNKQPDGSWVGPTAGAPARTEAQAAVAGAFRCPAIPASMRRDGPTAAHWQSWAAMAPLAGLQGGKCSSPTDQDGAVTPSVECPERIINGLVPLAGAPAQIVECVRSGTGPGKCRVNVPSYTVPVEGGRTFEMGNFDVEPTDESPYGQCYSAEDCSFTQDNFYHLPAIEDPGFRASFGSSRSMIATSIRDPGSNGSSYRQVTCEDTRTGFSYLQCISFLNINNYIYGNGNTRLYRQLALYERVFSGGIVRYPGVQVAPEGNSFRKIGACIAAPPLSAGTAEQAAGTCVGGLNDGQACSPTGPNRCITEPSTQINDQQSACGPVARLVDGVYVPVSTPQYSCLIPGSTGILPPSGPGVSLNEDNNMCTHEQGYVPRADLCPNPRDEYCGLIAYNVRQPATSIAPSSNAFLPTDVTLGLHKLSYLQGTADTATGEAYKSFYAARPPQVAAPDIQNCPTPGKCAVQGLNKISLDGSSEGLVNVAGSQSKTTLRFYAWASHNQMPLRSIMIDWGDGQRQAINDGKMKNRKPFCGVRKECVTTTATGSQPRERVDSSGLTCSTDNDCPVGGGSCKAIGTCRNKPNLLCSTDDNCRDLNNQNDKDVCQIRTMFGNAPEACEENFFEFTHLYTCGGPTTLPACQVSGYGRSTVTASTLLPLPEIPVGSCYFGTRDAEVIRALGGTRPTTIIQPATECISRYNSALSLRNGDPGFATALNASTLGVTYVTAGTPRATAGVAQAVQATTYRCERDPDRVCNPANILSTTEGCAPGDRCVENLAPAGGCWDNQIQTCRFTPKVMVQDNWGWCTGECRAARDVGGAPTDNRTGTTPVALHPYGGCYSATPIGSSQAIRDNLPGGIRNDFINECTSDLPRSERQSFRPWVVYSGSINLRSSR